MVKLLDCTTRDGGHCFNWNFSVDYIFDLIDKLNNYGIYYYEIGYRNFYDRENKGEFYHCLPDFIRKFYNVKNNLKIGVMTDAKRFDETDFKNAEIDFTDFVRIAAPPDKIEDAVVISELLNKRKYNVMLQLMDISNLKDEHFKLMQGVKNKDIFLTLYLADTYGIIKPDELNFYFDKFKSQGYKNISFHAHNKTASALKNTLKAIECGAYSVDVSQTDDGINGGNLSFDELKSAVNII